MISPCRGDDLVIRGVKVPSREDCRRKAAFRVALQTSAISISLLEIYQLV